MIAVGQLDTPITIESPTTIANANYGGVQATTYATALSAFGDVVSAIWAHLIWKGGGEGEEGEQMTGRSKVEFYIRYNIYKEIIKPNWRIKYSESDSLSKEVLINPTFDPTIPIGDVGSGWGDVDDNVTYVSGGAKFARVTGNCRLRAKVSGGGGAVMQYATLYRIAYKVTAVNSDDPVANVDDFKIYIGGLNVAVAYSLGNHTYEVTSGVTDQIFQFSLGTNNSNISIDNVSVKEITKNTSYYYIDKIDHIDGRDKITRLTAIEKDNN